MNESDLEKAGTAGLINQDNSAKSVYAQIRDAKRQSDSQSNFCCIVIDIIFSTICFVVSCSIALLIPITMIVLGAINIDRCPAQKLVPIWLLVGGITGLLSMILSLIRSHLAKRNQIISNKNTSNVALTTVSSILGLFNFVWFIAGSFWIFGIYHPNTFDATSPDFCDAASYFLGFAILVASYLFLLSLSCACCIISCFISW